MSKKKTTVKNEKSSFLTDKIKKLEWQDWALLAIIILLVISQLGLLNQFKHLPSPVYGGDWYRDRGFIQNIVSDNPAWSDAYYLDEINYYPWLVPAISAGIVKLFSLDIEQFMIYGGLILQILSILVFYSLGKVLFKKKEFALIFAGLIAAAQLGSLLAPKKVAGMILFPLFFLIWLSYEKEQTKLKGLILGAVLGLTAWTYGATFLQIAGVFVITIMLKIIINIVKTKNFKEEIFTAIKKYYLVILAMLPFFLIFFLPLIIKYSFHIYNPVNKYGDISYAAMGLVWMVTALFKQFFNITSWYKFILGILAILGLVHCVINRKKMIPGTILLAFISGLILVEHHIITVPLFDAWFNTAKLTTHHFFIMIFSIYGIKEIYSNIKQYISRLTPLIFTIIIIILILVPTAIANHNRFEDNRWTKYGMTMDVGTKSIYDAGEWVENNVNIDETILANDETSFAIVALSGRKVMITRRTHASYFIDIDKRISEAAVAIYGNDINETIRVLKEYKVSYFFEDGQLLRSPLRTRLDQQEYLDNYNVKYYVQNNPWDHASPQSTSFDFVYIPPQNISEEFRSLLEPVAVFGPQQQPMGVMYKINYQE